VTGNVTGNRAEALFAAGLGARHGFFTRRGGLSAGPYASLNCSLSGGDDRATVLANRARAAHALDLDPALLVGLLQVHGADVVPVNAAWASGDGPRADSMVTRASGIALAIVTADCAPVLLADPAAGVVGAAHAGWRGAVGGVLDATVAAMVALGAAPARIAAAIGPCIGQRSYEVGRDLHDAVVGRDPADARFLAAGKREERWQFDLAGYCAGLLRGLGVETVETVSVDTCADEERFFSHRRRVHAGGGPIGHQMSIIALNA